MTPPATVTDLSVKLAPMGASPAAVLSWTAPSDVPGAAAAATYDVRMATDLSSPACPLTAANFASAQQVTGAPTPAAPATLETFTATVPASASQVCFAVISKDAALNTSELSNVASPSRATS